MQFSQRQRGQKTQGVEMAGMIGHNDEGIVAEQPLGAHNFKTVIAAQPQPQDQSDACAQRVDQHVWFARKIAEPFGRRLLNVRHLVMSPAFHRRG